MFGMFLFLFFPSLTWTFPSFTEWKTTGSFGKQIQQYIKGEQSMPKWNKLRMMYCIPLSQRQEKREKMKTWGQCWGDVSRKSERLTEQIDMQCGETSWQTTCLSRITSPESKPLSAISFQKADVSLHLSSARLTVTQAVQSSSHRDSCLSLFSPFLPPSLSSPSLPLPELRSALNLALGFQSLFSWAS